MFERTLWSLFGCSGVRALGATFRFRMLSVALEGLQFCFVPTGGIIAVMHLWLQYLWLEYAGINVCAILERWVVEAYVTEFMSFQHEVPQ